MNRSRTCVILLIAFFASYQTSGTKVKIHEHKQTKNNDVSNLLQNEGNFNNNHDIAGYLHQSQSESVVNPRYQEHHPLYDSQNQEGSSSHFQNGGEYSINSDVNSDSIALSLIEKLVDFPHDFSKSSSDQVEPIDLSTKKSNQHSLLEQPQEKPLDLTVKNKMVELVPKSGIMMDRLKLEKLVYCFRGRGRILIRRLIDELIPRAELIKMQLSPRMGGQTIPKNILDAIESFVNYVAEPKFNHHQFRSTINSHLMYLKKSAKKSNIPFQTNSVSIVPKLPSSPIPKVELVSGTGVMIDKNKLYSLVFLYRQRPKFMVRNLFDMLIPLKELVTMRSSPRNGNNFIPIRIRNAVEDFINDVAEPKLTHQVFMNTISKYLSKRREQYNSKIKSVTYHYQ